ncbi:MAG: DNA mismatch repair endonuclease MutL [Bdellovibrionales bacterium]|nr:DNA mismatch repair endonuclease MutL [Bdellovibrionales bacterium]
MIEILSPEVVDQIAAGEVVERPAHLVKELVENSIDAGATQIEVEFDQGGRQVKIIDDGAGMGPSELPLALARHATSKIKLSSDLWDLHSFGFRGEALASISAVSKVQIRSRQKNSKTASRILSEFGQASAVESIGGEPGTTILVEDLFANVPARLKFLKSEAAESTQIKNVLRAMALAHPQVTFRVRHKNKLLFFWPAMSTHLQRAKQILEVDELFWGEGECNGIKTKAAMSSPNRTVKNSRQIWLFAQNRWIQDRSLQAAVIDAYRSLLMHGEFPVAAIWVSCDPEDIDVNIHPTKSQVKFLHPSDAFRSVNRAIRHTLETAPWLDAVLAADPQRISSSSVSESKVAYKTAPGPTTNFKFSDSEFQRTQYSQKSMMGTLQELGLKASPPKYEVTPSPSVEIASAGSEENFALNESSPFEVNEKKGYWSQLQVIGQANLTYIVAQTDRAILFVDQHAAHERVMYETLMRAWNSGNIEVQDYLLPLTFDLEPEEVESVIKLQPDFEKLGVYIDEMGPQTIGVRAAPAVIKEKSIQAAIELVATEMVEKGGSFALEKSISDICATLACHSVIRAGQALSVTEMTSLLKQMDEFPLSSFCPHGRPVYVEYPFSKLERDFGRIV